MTITRDQQTFTTTNQNNQNKQRDSLCTSADRVQKQAQTLSRVRLNDHSDPKHLQGVGTVGELFAGFTEYQ